MEKSELEYGITSESVAMSYVVTQLFDINRY